MRIVITGGFGFLGQRVAAALLTTRTFRGAPIDRLVLADRVVPSGSTAADPSWTSYGATWPTGSTRCSRSRWMC